MGIPLQRLQRETTSREFLEWVEYLDKEEWTKNHRADFYMAQIAMEAARPHAKNPGELKIEDYLIKFTTVTGTAAPPTEEELEKRAQFSKAKWLGITGHGAGKPPANPAAPPTPPKRGGRSLTRGK